MQVFFVNRRLAFGSAITNWRHVEQLRTLGITHVLNLRRCQDKMVRQFPNLRLGFRDNSKPRPAWFYRLALQFYKRAMRQSKTKLFVMCHHGQCRSPSMAYFFLRVSGVAPQKAETIVHRAKPSAKVVPGYRSSGEDFLQRSNNDRLKERARKQ